MSTTLTFMTLDPARVTLSLLRWAATALLVAASTTARANEAHPAPGDPWEAFNRPVFAFNDTVDNYTLKPLAKAYEANVSAEVRNGVANVFNNLSEPFNALNHVLQGRLQAAGISVLRLGVNSTIGVLGFFDIAGNAGLSRQPRDFGQTLAVWGLDSGPYVVLPLLGPTTLRDGTARVATANVLQIGAVSDVPLRNSLQATELLSSRSELLPLDRVVDDVALDRYAFVRDAWLQRRVSTIADADADAPRSWGSMSQDVQNR